MDRKKIGLFYLIVLTISSFALGDCLRLKEADNGKTNVITSGNEIEIVLEGNPTTGYEWNAASFSTNTLQKIGEVQYRPTEYPDRIQRVGAGGRFIFKFKTIKEGKGDIKIIYRRPWETTDCDKVYLVILDIK